MYKFKPLEEYGNTKPANHILPIPEPPCKHCKWWSPQAIFYQAFDGFHFDSVRLCWAEPGSMHQDFSCYIPKET